MPLQSRHLMDDGVTFTLSRIKNHYKVKNIEVLQREFFYALLEIERSGTLPNLQVYVADVYILTADDVAQIVSKYPGINSIVVISNWNQYTDKAKELAKEYNVGVFTFIEFMRALNYGGEKFLETGNPKETE